MSKSEYVYLGPARYRSRYVTRCNRSSRFSFGHLPTVPATAPHLNSFHIKMPATTSSNQTSQGGKPGNNHHNHKKGGRRTNNANTNAPKPPTPPVNGTIAPVVIKEDDGDEEEVCWICAEPVTIYSVAQCNHRTCHVCALRLRALYKKMECTFCKVSLPLFSHRI